MPKISLIYSDYFFFVYQEGLVFEMFEALVGIVQFVDSLYTKCLKSVAQRTNMGIPVIMFNITNSIVAAEWLCILT